MPLSKHLSFFCKTSRAWCDNGDFLVDRHINWSLVVIFMVRRFQDILLWQKSYSFANRAYDVSLSFPKEEVYALTSQFRRAALSIPLNVAEGCGRETRKDFVRFLYIAVGSLRECQCVLLFAKDRSYLSVSDFERLYADLDALAGMFHRFIENVRY